MWGCIAENVGSIQKPLVPSLYVRVYRTRKKFSYLYQCSLTVCEGVSVDYKCIADPCMFPHCMWGCIESIKCNLHFKTVPSLYVRVYRNIFNLKTCRNGSLTVCEGVSEPHIYTSGERGFPHCMWGCIEAMFCVMNIQKVPSLYVRVYRSI